MRDKECASDSDIVNTGSGTTYQPRSTYELTAGVGAFNSSLVEPVIDLYTEDDASVPYGLLALVNDLVTNPTISISVNSIGCTDPSCVAYLLAGGLITTTPWPPTTDAESPIVEIWNAPAIQVEFEDRISSSDQFLQSDCDIIGDPTKIVAVQICTAESKSSPGSIISRKLDCNSFRKPSLILTN